MDAVEGLLTFLAFVCHWRVLLSLAVFGGISTLLVVAFPWLNGLQGCAMAAAGLVLGAMWEERSQPLRTPPRQTKPAVAVLSCFFASLVWAGASSLSASSVIAGLIILLSVTLLAIGYVRVHRPSVPTTTVALCAGVAIATYGVTLLVRTAAL